MAHECQLCGRVLPTQRGLNCHVTRKHSAELRAKVNSPAKVRHVIPDPPATPEDDTSDHDEFPTDQFFGADEGVPQSSANLERRLDWAPLPFQMPETGQVVTEEYGSAGKVLDVRPEDLPQCLPFQTQPRSRSNHWPFVDATEWNEALFINEVDASNAKIDEYFARMKSATPEVYAQRLELGYSLSAHTFNKKVEQMNGGLLWSEKKFTIPGTSREFVLWMRNPLEVIRRLIGNPNWGECLAFRPSKVWTNNTKTDKARIYSEMSTGDWWWNTQAQLPVGATVVPLIFASDATLMSRGSGNVSAWPVYLSIGNIPKHLRQQRSENAMIPIAFLPTDRLAREEVQGSEKDYTRAHQNKFHAAIGLILQSLERAAIDGIPMLCGDGHVRLCFPILAAWIADYPEQCKLAGIQMQRCPRCMVSREELDSDAWFEPRDQGEMIQSLEAAKKFNGIGARDAYLSENGISLLHQPFWPLAPRCNVHRDAFNPDPLHQLLKGMLYDHLFQWCTDAMGTKLFDERLKRLPPAPGLKRFPNGTSCINGWSGNEYRPLMRQILGVIQGALPPLAVEATRHLLDFIYLSGYASHTGETLEYLDSALEGFHKTKEVFRELADEAEKNKRANQEEDEVEAQKHKTRMKNIFNFIKLHALSHYSDSIRSHGTTDNYTTETSENLHSSTAKRPYQTTNHHNPIAQIVRNLERKSHFRTRVEYRDYINRVRSPAPPPPPTVSSRVLLSRSSAHKCRAIPASEIENTHGIRAGSLVEECRKYVRKWYRIHPDQTPASGVPRDAGLGEDTRFRVWHSVRIRLPQLNDDRSFAELIRANPAFAQQDGDTTPHPRFDTVLVPERGDDLDPEIFNNDSSDGKQVVRLRAILELTDFVGRKHRVVYVEWFTALGKSPEPSHNMFKVKHEKEGRNRRVGVLDANCIIRSVHLFPKFPEGGFVPGWTAWNVLDECTEFFINNFLDDHLYATFY